MFGHTADHSNHARHTVDSFGAALDVTTDQCSNAIVERQTMQCFVDDVPFASSQSLYEKIKTTLKRISEGDVPHGLRVTAAVRLIEAGCSEDQAAAITRYCDLNVLRNYVRGANQAKLARQAIRKQEAAGR